MGPLLINPWSCVTFVRGRRLIRPLTIPRKIRLYHHLSFERARRSCLYYRMAAQELVVTPSSYLNAFTSLARYWALLRGRRSPLAP